MGLAAFNRMRREVAERAAQEVEQDQANEKPVDKMTVKELREKLVSLGVNPDESAKKAELVGLLESVLNLDNKENQDELQDDQGDGQEQQENDGQEVDQSQEENNQPE